MIPCLVQTSSGTALHQRPCRTGLGSCTAGPARGKNDAEEVQTYYCAFAPPARYVGTHIWAEAGECIKTYLITACVSFLTSFKFNIKSEKSLRSHGRGPEKVYDFWRGGKGILIISYLHVVMPAVLFVGTLTTASCLMCLH